MLFSVGKVMYGSAGDSILGVECRLCSEMFETGGFVMGKRGNIYG
jgi:hypothetical protein